MKIFPMLLKNYWKLDIELFPEYPILNEIEIKCNLIVIEILFIVWTQVTSTRLKKWARIILKIKPWRYNTKQV